METPEPVRGGSHYDPKTSTLTVRRTNTQKGEVLTRYHVQFLDPHPEIGSPAFRLTKLTPTGERSDELRDVILRRWGPECTCGDQNYRRTNSKDPCKHIRALQAQGLLPKETR